MTTTKARPAPWNEAENKAICELYFTMLDRAIAGEAYNKAAMIRNEIDQPDAPNRLMTYPLADRSKGSVEAKLMNCSATHRDLLPDVTTMDGFGYRCLSNYQSTLKDAMRLALSYRRPMSWPGDAEPRTLSGGK